LTYERHIGIGAVRSGAPCGLIVGVSVSEKLVASVFRLKET